jgi:IS30 family transposase
MTRLTKKEISQIKLYHSKGWSERKIAAKVKRSRSTVWFHIQKKK